MAGDPIKIRIDGETQDAERSLEAVADSLEQVDKALDKVEDASKDVDRALDKIEDAADDAARTIDRDLITALKDARAASEKAGRELSDGMADGTRRSSESVAEFKDEAKQNFSEVTSSFSGDMDSAVDLVQGTLGGLAASIPGYGLALGGLAATAGGFYNAWKTKAEATKKAIQDMYADMKESGNDFLSESFIQGEVDKIVTGAEEAVTSFDTVKEQAEFAGVSMGTMLRAWAGDAEALAEVYGKLEKATADNEEAQRRLTDQEAITGQTNQAAWEEINTRRQEIERMSEALGKTVDNQDRARAAVEAGRTAMKATAETTREAADAEAAYRDTVSASADAIKTNGKNLAANRQAILDAVSAAVDYTDALKANGASAKTVDDAQRSMYSRLVDLAEQAGLTEKDARNLINTFVDFPDDIETGVTLDSAEAERRLRAIQNGNYTATVKVTTDASGVVRQIENALTGKTVRINVMPRVGRPVVGG